MIGTEHILAALRLRRLAIGMLLVPLLVLNLVAAILVASHAARASAFDDIIARSRCLTSSEAMPPETTLEKAPVKPGHHQPCPACATTCITGCCAGPALTGNTISLATPQLAAGLYATTAPGRCLVVPAQFRSSLRAQAPPRCQASQSFNAS